MLLRRSRSGVVIEVNPYRVLMARLERLGGDAIHIEQVVELPADDPGGVNRELRTLFPAEPASAGTPELIKLAGRRGPVRRWVVTDGPGPVWFCDGTGEPVSLQPPPVKEVSPTGSGDVLLACVLDALFRRGLTLAQAVAGALPLAAANAAHPGIAEFPWP